jgi:hypothetical protein
MDKNKGIKTPGAPCMTGKKQARNIEQNPRFYMEL